MACQLSRLLMITLLFTFTLVACGTRPVKFLAGQISARNEKDKDGVVTSALWVKNKGRSVEVMMTLLNGYDKPIRYEQMKLTADGQTSISTETVITNFTAAGNSQRGTVVFKFAEKLPKRTTALLTIEKIAFDEDQTKAVLPDLKMEFPLHK